MAMRYIDELGDLKGKKVFIRVDFNVPQDDKGAITEDTRIAGAVPTRIVGLTAAAMFSLFSRTHSENCYRALQRSRVRSAT